MKGDGTLALIFLFAVWAFYDRGEHNLHRFLFLHFCYLCKKYLLDSYFGHACVALLNSVGLYPSTLVCQFAGLVYLPPEMDCVSSFMTKQILVFLLEHSSARFLYL